MSTETANEYRQKGQGQKLMEKAKDAPFVPLGILGTIGMLAWGAHQFKNKGTMSTSVFMMHLRVKAQGVIVGSLALGVAISMINDHVLNKESRKEKRRLEREARHHVA